MEIYIPSVDKLKATPVNLLPLPEYFQYTPGTHFRKSWAQSLNDLKIKKLYSKKHKYPVVNMG